MYTMCTYTHTCIRMYTYMHTCIRTNEEAGGEGFALFIYLSILLIYVYIVTETVRERARAGEQAGERERAHLGDFENEEAEELEHFGQILERFQDQLHLSFVLFAKNQRRLAVRQFL